MNLSRRGCLDSVSRRLVDHSRGRVHQPQRRGGESDDDDVNGTNYLSQRQKSVTVDFHLGRTPIVDPGVLK